jgi:hypothetical protein
MTTQTEMTTTRHKGGVEVTGLHKEFPAPAGGVLKAVDGMDSKGRQWWRQAVAMVVRAWSWFRAVTWRAETRRQSPDDSALLHPRARDALLVAARVSRQRRALEGLADVSEIGREAGARASERSSRCAPGRSCFPVARLRRDGSAQAEAESA